MSWKATAYRVALVALVTGLCSRIPSRGDSYPMRTIEGELLAVSLYAGEGDLDLMLAELRLADGSGEAMQILLAPHEVCDELGLELEPGDRVRARIFLGNEGPWRVQKIQNLSRGTMVRLRTLHQTPLWNTAGSWQGGPMRTTPGRHRHGQTGRGTGPPRR